MKTLIILLLSTLTVFADTTIFVGTGDKGIYSCTLNQESGRLSQPVLAAEIRSSGFLAKHPKLPILYATGEPQKGVGSVASFIIGKNGVLKAQGEQPSKGGRLCHISLDASAAMLMGANYRDGYVISYPLGADGSIGKSVSKHIHQGSSVNPKRQTAPHAHSIYSGPDNRFAYAPDLGIDKVMIYKINPATAELTPAGSAASPAGAGPRHMKFGNDGKQAYVLNELTLSISVFDRDPATGMLSPVQVVSTLPEGEDKDQRSCSEIRISKDGKFIYCANRDLSEKGRDSLSVFKVGDGGKITRIQTIGAEVWVPRNINLDPSGKWLIVAGQRSDNVPVFKINSQSGQLSYTGNQVAVPKAMCIEFH